MEKYLSIPKNEEFFSEIIIKKSRFLGFCKYVESKDEAETYLKSLKNKYPDSTHICYAYKLTNSAKLSDDGEPSGTAGKPILTVLEQKGLVNVVLAVVRYFGGVKLGAGGLMRAYLNTAIKVIDSAPKVSWEECEKVQIILPINEYQSFLHSIKGRKVVIVDRQFGQNVELTCVRAMNEIINNEKVIQKLMWSFDE